MKLQKAIQIPITPAETKLSLKALCRKLHDAYPYSYGYNGTPPYIKHQILSINLRLSRLITTANNLQTHCPAKFYKTKEVSK